MGKMEQRRKYFSLNIIQNLCVLLLPPYIVLSLGVSMNKIITCFTTTLNRCSFDLYSSRHKTSTAMWFIHMEALKLVNAHKDLVNIEA